MKNHHLPQVPLCTWNRPIGLGWDKPYTVRNPSNLDMVLGMVCLWAALARGILGVLLKAILICDILTGESILLKAFPLVNLAFLNSKAIATF